MTSVAAMPSTNNWYNPGGYLPDLTEIQVNSPQAPDNPALDSVQLTINALYGGRAAAVSAMNVLEQRENVRLQNLHNSGVMTTAALSTMGKGALVGGGISILRQMAHLAQGEVTVARAAGNVTSDIMNGAIGGLAAGAAGGLVVQAVSNTGGVMTGTLGTLAGVLGYAAATWILDSSGLKDAVSDKITSLLEGVDDQALPFELSQQGAAPAYNPYSG